MSARRTREIERVEAEFKRILSLSPRQAEAEREGNETYEHWLARKVLAAAREGERDG